MQPRRLPDGAPGPILACVMRLPSLERFSGLDVVRGLASSARALFLLRRGQPLLTLESTNPGWSGRGGAKRGSVTRKASG